ncbi:MAG: CBS domain-containing protein [Planctomycetes bacterium]|nr:CBS domain-containing protein [Planctomycetota bacterium]
MHLKELMTKDVESVAPSATLRHAAERMAALDVGFLPVADDAHPVGVLTDRDIAIRAVAAGRNPDETTVRDVMTTAVQMLDEDQDVEEAARLMRDRKIRRVLVKGADGRLCGVVSLGDLAVDVGNDLSAEVLQGVSQPAEPQRA